MPYFVTSSNISRMQVHMVTHATFHIYSCKYCRPSTTVFQAKFKSILHGHVHCLLALGAQVFTYLKNLNLLDWTGPISVISVIRGVHAWPPSILQKVRTLFSSKLVIHTTENSDPHHTHRTHKSKPRPCTHAEAKDLKVDDIHQSNATARAVPKTSCSRAQTCILSHANSCSPAPIRSLRTGTYIRHRVVPKTTGMCTYVCTYAYTDERMQNAATYV
jgi:hypothetical protein